MSEVFSWKMSNPQSLRASPEGHPDPTRVGRRLIKRRQSGANLPKFKKIYKSYFRSKVRKLLLNLP